MRSTCLAAFAAFAAVALAGACVPKAPPLGGATPAAPVRLPAEELPAGHRRIVFRWSYEEGELSARGEGVARLASPDSMRLDLFLEGAFGGSGSAFLIGDTITAPGREDAVRRMLPPPPLLWAAVGRTAIPARADTLVRVDGDTIRADIGRDQVWRLAFVHGRLVRLERLDGGRRVEHVTRTGGGVRYVNERSGQSLRLEITRTDEVPPFDVAIWQR